MNVTIHPGDNRQSLRRLIDEGVRVHSVVTDPPYGLVSIQKRFGKEGSAAARTDRNDGSFARLSGGFVGKIWDGSEIERDPEFWGLIHEILLPGGFVFAFSGSRTGHWQACAMETAGFIMHPMHGWAFGTGLPKAHSAQRAMSKAGHQDAAQWVGWGYGTQTQKPALEIIYLGQKPFDCKTGAANLLKNGVGALNIDGCRVGGDGGRHPSNLILDGSPEVSALFPEGSARFFHQFPPDQHDEVDVTWTSDAESHQVRLLVDTEQSPPKVIAASQSDTVSGWNTYLFGSTITDQFQMVSKSTIGTKISSITESKTLNWLMLSLTSASMEGASSETANGSNLAGCAGQSTPSQITISAKTEFRLGANRVPSGSLLNISVCARSLADPLIYHAKAGKLDRAGSFHPTVKPIALMQYLVRHITPPGGVVLDPFAGSGTTAEAAQREGFDCILMEAEDEYLDFLRDRFDIDPLLELL